MLHNPTWDKKPKEKPSLGSFITWLRSKDPTEEYDYHNTSGSCLYGQYMTHMGISWGIDRYHQVIGQVAPTHYAGMKLAAGGEETFGAALARAEALQAKNLKARVLTKAKALA